MEATAPFDRDTAAGGGGGGIACVFKDDDAGARLAAAGTVTLDVPDELVDRARVCADD